MPDIDKELAKSIQAAKKKPCNFAIIGKGANVLKLIISKKPILEGTLAAAKKEFSGSFVVTGVLTGSEAGPELVFQVLEMPTLGENKLRAHIADEAGLTVKPLFQLVTKLPEVTDSDDDNAQANATGNNANAISPPQEPQIEASQFSEAKASTSNAPALNFASRLKTIKPGLDRLLNSQTSVTAELKQLSSEMASLASKSEFDSAGELLNRIELLVRGGLKEIAEQTAPESNHAASFNSRFKSLLPQIKQAIESNLPNSLTIKSKAAEAGVLAKGNDFIQANSLLDQIEQLLQQPPRQQLPEQQPPPPQIEELPPEPPRQQEPPQEQPRQEQPPPPQPPQKRPDPLTEAASKFHQARRQAVQQIGPLIQVLNNISQISRDAAQQQLNNSAPLAEELGEKVTNFDQQRKQIVSELKDLNRILDQITQSSIQKANESLSDFPLETHVALAAASFDKLRRQTANCFIDLKKILDTISQIARKSSETILTD